MSCKSEGQPLHCAVRLGDVKTVHRIVNQDHLDINERDSSGNTLLMLAVCIKDEHTYNSIVEILIKSGADVNAFNKGITPLYNAVFYEKGRAVEMLLRAGAKVTKDSLFIAAERGTHEILKLLLENSTDKKRIDTIINSPDDKGRTAVFRAAYNGHKECLKLLVEKGGNLSHVTHDNESVMDVVFEQVSRPADFILEVLDSCVCLQEGCPKEGKNRYFVDFTVLAPGECARQMDVISSLVVAASDEEKTRVLQHPIIELFLTLKWSRMCYFFYLWIVGYVVFAVSMSVYVTLLTRNYAAGLETVFTGARCLLIISAIALLLHAILQCLLTHRNHFRKYEMWLNLACTSLSLIVALPAPAPNMPNWVLHVTSVAVLLAWTELMLLIGRLPTYGYYALMFSAVLQNVIRVLLAFLCLVIGFALSFSIQFSTFEQFSDPWRALVKTIVMMMGEFEYADLFAEKTSDLATSRVIFLMFIILTSIVLMNLMVGLAVSDIQSLQMESHARKLEKQADFLAQLEKVICSERLSSRFVPGFVKRLFRRSSIETGYELQTSTQFRRAKKLSCRLIDSLISIAKSKRNGDFEESANQNDIKNKISDRAVIKV